MRHLFFLWAGWAKSPKMDPPELFIHLGGAIGMKVVNSGEKIGKVLVNKPSKVLDQVHYQSDYKLP